MKGIMFIYCVFFHVFLLVSQESNSFFSQGVMSESTGSEVSVNCHKETEYYSYLSESELVDFSELTEYSYPAHSYENKSFYRLSYDIHAGVWIPVGDLSKIFGVAPSWGFSVGYLFNRSLSLDFVMQMILPSSCKPFTFNYDGRITDTKSSLIWDFDLRMKYRLSFGDGAVLTLLGGSGISIIGTDIEKESYSDDASINYYSATALKLIGGINIKRDKLGAFIEYHYTPYSMSAGIENKDFGSGAFFMGVLYGF